MTSIKIKFRPSTIINKEGVIYYQITHKRKPRQLLTKYRIFPNEWDRKRSVLILEPTNRRYLFLLTIRERIRWDINRIRKIISKLDQDETFFETDDIINEFHKYTQQNTLFNYTNTIIFQLKHNGKIRTSETYRATLNSFQKFQNNEDIMLDTIDSRLIESYQAWLQSKGLSDNTVSFYNRILRAIYNRAVEEEIIVNRHPFRHVYTGIDKTVKRALPLPIIKKIKILDLSLYPSLEFARDMFMLSFMLRGMSFVDMAFLKKSCLLYNHITYRRRKTGQTLSIEWTQEMQSILKKYPKNPTEYLLPIITDKEINERYAYKKIGAKINHSLKLIANKLQLQFPLSMYVARHSWASIARSRGIPVSVISEGLGHDNELTTQIYLASLENSVIDKANKLIMNLL